jgi:hypothetical protein
MLSVTTMILPGGATLNFNPDDVTTRAQAPGRPAAAITPLSAPVRVTLCLGLGMTSCRPPGIPGAGFVLAQEFEVVMT